MALRSWISARSTSSAIDSIDAQSIGTPSSTATASSAMSPSLVATSHPLHQPEQCTLCSLACRIGRRLPECFRKFRVGAADLDTGDDGLSILRRQPLERALVALHGFPSDRLLER